MLHIHFYFHFLFLFCIFLCLFFFYLKDGNFGPVWFRQMIYFCRISTFTCILIFTFNVIFTFSPNFNLMSKFNFCLYFLFPFFSLYFFPLKDGNFGPVWFRQMIYFCRISTAEEIYLTGHFQYVWLLKRFTVSLNLRLNQ